MLPMQVEYWKNEELKRHNLETEKQGWENLKYVGETAAANTRNAATNEYNAGINLMNAQTNQRNARTNEWNASSNAKQASAALTQAEAAMTNAAINAGNLGLKRETFEWDKIMDNRNYLLESNRFDWQKWKDENQFDLWKAQADQAIANADLSYAQKSKYEQEVDQIIQEMNRYDALIDSEIKKNNYTGSQNATKSLNNFADLITKLWAVIGPLV